MNDVWKAIADEFVDLPSGAQFVRVAVRLVLAAILGGILGYDAKRRASRPACGRT